MIHRGTYDGTIYYNPANKFCIISVKTAEKDVPEEARSIRRRKDHLIRFVATGYELPRTDAVELELDGEWKKGKYGMQLQVEQWHEIVPQTKSGVEGYLASGLIKGIGPALAKQIVSRFGVETLDILQNRPERLLEIKGITENKLEAIKTSYAESRMLQDLMTLLSPFKITPKTAQKIYQFFGPASVDILKKSPFELCQISGFGFLRVDAIVQKNGGDLRAPMRIKGALFWALEDSKGKNGHLFLTSEALQKEALQLLNAKIPIPSLRLHAQEVSDVLEDMILHGEVVSVKGDIYLPRVFAQEDETARRIAMRVVEPPAPEKIEQILEQVKREIGLALSSKQEAAVYATYRHNLSIITGSPGTGKTTVLKTILEVYRRLHPQGEIALMAPTGRASRRMAESTGVDKAKTLHSILGLASEEDEIKRNNTQEPLSADLIIVDEFSMVDMWLANKFFSRIKGGARVILVGDPDQLPSVGAGNVFRELIDCGLITVTVLDQIFRQSKDSLIAYNAKFINEGNTKLYYGQDFVFMASNNQAEAAERIVARYCREIEESGIDRVQILSPFRSDGAASAEQLNEAILKLTTTLMANTKGDGKGGDPFWDKAETLLYCALIGYIHYEAPKEEQNFATLIEFINAMEVREDDEDFQNLQLDEENAIPFAFKDITALKAAGYEQPPAAMYYVAGSGEIYCPAEESDDTLLKRLFADCRERLPEGCRGRPMAVSDVVELNHGAKRAYYYVSGQDQFRQVKFSPMLAKKEIPEKTQERF